MRDILLSVSVLVLLCISTASAKKERQWQPGKLLDMNGVNVTFLAGDVAVTVGSVARSRINETYQIEPGEYHLRVPGGSQIQGQDTPHRQWAGAIRESRRTIVLRVALSFVNAPGCA